MVDHDTNHKNEILLSDIAEIKKACGWDTSVKESEADSFDKKNTKDKVKDIAGKTLDVVSRVGMVVGGAALVVGTSGLAGTGMIGAGFGSKNSEMRTTDEICQNALTIEAKINTTHPEKLSVK